MRNKQSDYIGKEALEKMKEQLKNGENHTTSAVGLELGGKPVEDYANDFWLISNDKGGKPVGFITSPWYHPEKGTNIAMDMFHSKEILARAGFQPVTGKI